MLYNSPLLTTGWAGNQLSGAETDHFTLPQLSLQLFRLVMNLWCKLALKERGTTNEIKHKPGQKQEGEGAMSCFLRSLMLQLAWFSGVRDPSFNLWVKCLLFSVLTFEITFVASITSLLQVFDNPIQLIFYRYNIDGYTGFWNFLALKYRHCKNSISVGPYENATNITLLTVSRVTDAELFPSTLQMGPWIWVLKCKRSCFCCSADLFSLAYQGGTVNSHSVVVQ